MKKILLGLCLSLITVSAFASSAPTLKDLSMGTFQGRSFISECGLSLEENAEGKIVATFNKGGLSYKSAALDQEVQIMVSSNQQVWVDFTIEGMTHVSLTLNSESDLTPNAYTVLEGRSTTVYKCKNLK